MTNTPKTEVHSPIDHSNLYRHVAKMIKSFSLPGYADPSRIRGVWMVAKNDAAVAKELWDAYLGLFPEDQRQHFNCMQCKRWFERYATIQVVGFHEGNVNRRALCWSVDDETELTEHEFLVINTLRELTLKHTPSRLVFKRERMAIDRAPGEDQFEHFFCTSDVPRLPSFEILKTNDQYQANKEILSKFLTSELEGESVDRAVRLFTMDPQYAGYSTHRHRFQLVKTAKDTLATLQGADRGIYLSLLALTELTTIRSGLVGAFLFAFQESGMDGAKALFKEMADPKQYRTPSALPHSQQVELAEEIIMELGLQNSLLFDVAKTDDSAIPWLAKYEEPTTETAPGIFSHLKTADKKPVEVTDVMNLGALSFSTAWDKYLSTALSIELDIDIATPRTYGLLGVMQNREAPPILSYDQEDNRCPIAALVFDQAVAGMHVGLRKRIKVEGIVVDPARSEKQDEQSQWFFVTTIPTQAGVTVGNLLSTQVRKELHEYWRVLHQFNKDRQQYIVEGSAVLIPIVRVSGQSWPKYSPIQLIHATLADGSKVCFSVLTA